MRKLFKLHISILLFVFIFSVACEQKQETKPVDLMNFELNEINIDQLQKDYKEGKYTIKQVIQLYIDRINAVDPTLNSVIIINPDALQIAEELDKELAEGKSRGPMHGVPVLLKDNIDTHDKMPTTAGSRALMNSHPLQDSPVAKKLREAGAIILGKTNLSEWANFRGDLSSSGWSGIGGQTNNPYNIRRNPCGSSAGSGVAVSANLCMVALGTETNGSIVCPSTSNGIVGIKPTVGLLSRSGIVPISFTQDTPGPMARTVRDAAICLGAMTGIDSADSKTLASQGHYYTDYTQFLKKDGLKGKRIGFYTASVGTDYKVDTLLYKTVELLKSQGAEVIEIDKIYDRKVGGLSFQVLLYEFKDGLNKYFATLGPDAPVKSLQDVIDFNNQDSIELSFYDQHLMLMAQEKGDLESPEYKEALEGMLKGTREDGIDKIMDAYNLDAFMGPTGSPAWITDHTNGDHYMLSSSSPAAISGYPNITVPMGFIEGLPVGVSFWGRAWSEPQLLEIAFAYEQVTKYRQAPKFLDK